MRVKVTNTSKAEQGFHHLLDVGGDKPSEVSTFLKPGQSSNTVEMSDAQVAQVVAAKGLLTIHNVDNPDWKPDRGEPTASIPAGSGAPKAPAPALGADGAKPPVTEADLAGMDPAALKDLIKDRTGSKPAGNPGPETLMAAARAAVGLPEPGGAQDGTLTEEDEAAYGTAIEAGFQGDRATWVAAGKPKPTASEVV